MTILCGAGFGTPPACSPDRQPRPAAACAPPQDAFEVLGAWRAGAGSEDAAVLACQSFWDYAQQTDRALPGVRRPAALLGMHVGNATGRALALRSGRVHAGPRLCSSRRMPSALLHPGLQVGETFKATGRCISVAAGRVSFCYGLKGAQGGSQPGGSIALPRDTPLHAAGAQRSCHLAFRPATSLSCSSPRVLRLLEGEPCSLWLQVPPSPSTPPAPAASAAACCCAACCWRGAAATAWSWQVRLAELCRGADFECCIAGPAFPLRAAGLP